jgi:hypothetical protein
MPARKVTPPAGLRPLAASCHLVLLMAALSACASARDGLLEEDKPTVVGDLFWPAARKLVIAGSRSTGTLICPDVGYMFGERIIWRFTSDAKLVRLVDNKEPPGRREIPHIRGLSCAGPFALDWTDTAEAGGREDVGVELELHDFRPHCYEPLRFRFRPNGQHASRSEARFAEIVATDDRVWLWGLAEVDGEWLTLIFKRPEDAEYVELYREPVHLPLAVGSPGQRPECAVVLTWDGKVRAINLRSETAAWEIQLSGAINHWAFDSVFPRIAVHNYPHGIVVYEITCRKPQLVCSIPKESPGVMSVSFMNNVLVVLSTDGQYVL